MSEKIFKQSITRFGSILRPDIVTITENMFTWKKRNHNLINNDSKSFDINKITSVEIDSTLIGTNITIRTIAGDMLKLEKFTLVDAKEMKALIEQNQKSKPTNTNNNNNIVDEIIKLKQLLDSGVLSQDEFTKMKQKIINKT